MDAREFIPSFKARPGLSDWHVLDDSVMVKLEKQQRNRAKSSTNDLSDANGLEETPLENDSSIGKSNEAEENESAAKKDFEVATTITDIDSTADEVKLAYASLPNELVSACVEMGMKYYPNHQAALDAQKFHIKPSFFSPSSAEKEWMHLGEYCVIYTVHYYNNHHKLCI